MTTRSTAADNKAAPAGRGLFLATVIAGLLAGATISLLAFVVARYGPSGGNWSFRGNGALAVYTLFPALLSAGWTALVLHFRAHRAWFLLGIGAGLVGILLAAGDATLLPLFGAAVDQTVGPVLLLSLLVWTPLAPILATRLTRRAPAPRSLPIYLVAAGAWLVAVTAGLIGAGLLLPAGS